MTKEENGSPSGDGALPADALEACVEIIAELDAAGSPRELGERLLGLTRRFGVEHILAGVLPGRDRENDLIAGNSRRGECAAVLLDQGLATGTLSDEVVIDLAAEVTHHFFWSGESKAVEYVTNAGPDYNPRPNFGALGGVVVPIVASDGRKYGFSFYGERVEHDEAAVETLSFIANYAFARLLKVDLFAKGPKLRERQREVLKWAAEGKTDWEIATILDLSEHTVDKYIRQAKLALNASNRTAAIVLAMRYGLIS